MNRRLLLLTLFLLASTVLLLYIFMGLSPTPIDAFEVSERCPRICWLGINPGKTSAEEARILLRGSNQIDQDTFRRTEKDIQTVWFTNITKTPSAQVTVNFENNLVKSIDVGYFGRSLVMSDFIKLLGEPDEIVIGLFDTPDIGAEIAYSVYFRSRKAIIYVSPGNWEGPSPTDYVGSIVLNTDYVGKDIQPWIGYGQLAKYLPGQELPKGPYPTPPPP